jgi:hypothetical protein
MFCSEKFLNRRNDQIWKVQNQQFSLEVLIKYIILHLKLNKLFQK